MPGSTTGPHCYVSSTNLAEQASSEYSWAQNASCHLLQCGVGGGTSGLEARGVAEGGTPETTSKPASGSGADTLETL